MQEGRGHVVTIDALAKLEERVVHLDAAADEPVLVLPPDGTLTLGSFEELREAFFDFDGAICVAASPLPLSTTPVAAKLADAVARATGWSPVQRSSGWRPARAYPYPYALLGPAQALLDLARKLGGPSNHSDADLIATALLEGSHRLVLDTAAQVFHVLDGTGTDAVAVAGRAYSAGERPLVLVDPQPGAPALARLRHELADNGARDLARLLRYHSAVDFDDEVALATDDVLAIRFWTTRFSAAIIRAAEAAGVWSAMEDSPGVRSQVPLQLLSPRLHRLMEEDLDSRIWRLVVNHWPSVMTGGLRSAAVVRHEAGEANSRLESDHQDPGHAGGAVRLNDGYQGGGLFFPRQHWSNREVRPGSLAIWPSAFSHPHRAESVSRGVEYQLVLDWHPPAAEPNASVALND